MDLAKCFALGSGEHQVSIALTLNFLHPNSMTLSVKDLRFKVGE
jgi:hypothetical protein